MTCCCCVGATVHCCGEFGQGEGEIVLSQVNCVGTESSLFDCPMSSGRCSHLNDVGVTCEGNNYCWNLVTAALGVHACIVCPCIAKPCLILKLVKPRKS